MLQYLRYFIPVVAMLLTTGLAIAAHPAQTEQCPTLDANNPEQRAPLMDHVCYLSAPPGKPAHQASTPEALSAAG